MRKRTNAALAGLSAGLLVMGLASSQAVASPTQVASPDRETPARLGADNLPSPLADSQNALRKEAIAQVLSGKVTPVMKNGSEVVHMGGNRWVELKKKVDKVDPIFTILVEFGDQTKSTIGGAPGPQHNQIPEPDRVYDGGATDDNTTLWAPDFSRDYYQNLLFGGTKSMPDFFFQESGGKYSVSGDVADWVTVPYNEARYGYNANRVDGYWNFVKDSASAWYDAQVAAGKTPAEIKSYLQQFDVWDRYDYDGDGNFNEPDGYIDHFQDIHAGMGEEAGGGAQGADAIWSHRWYAFSNGVGHWGPQGNLLGGVPLGDSGLWIGDYTTEPENGGLGVFTHEYHHDLGLPDMYDTAGGDNGTGFWTLMSAGSWLSLDPQNIGSMPDYVGPWEKLFLGWLDYVTVGVGEDKTVTLGSAGDALGPLPQAVVVNLPDQHITTSYVNPYSGSYEWWGGSADNLNTTLSRSLDLTGASSSAAISAKMWYQIESGYDYLYGEVSTDGGTTWTQVGTPIDGSSGGNWVDKSWDLSAFTGQSVTFRFRYATDGGVHYDGPFLDDIALTADGATVWSDDVESGAAPWTANGFTRFGGSVSKDVPHFYLAENRQYTGYDKALQTGPYNFGNYAAQPDWVDTFPYQPGLLVWYVNYAYENNNTSAHPGHGLALPVDARPAPVTFPGGFLLGNRRQPFDATFGLYPTDEVTFRRLGTPVTVPSHPAISTFNDSDPNAYWSPENPWSSVKVAGAGVTIKVSQDIRNFIDVMVVDISS